MPENLPQPGRYDFGLSEDQEAAAARIHREAIVVDMLSQQAGANIFDHYPPALCEEFDRTIAEAGHFYEKFLRGVSRTEGLRVGKGCVSQGRDRWGPNN